MTTSAAHLPGRYLTGREEDARWEQLRANWHLPAYEAGGVWSLFRFIDGDKVNGCFKGKVVHISRRDVKRAGPFPCRRWDCGKCSNSMAKDIVESVAEALAMEWSPEYVPQTVMDLSLDSHRHSGGHIHVASWEDERGHDTVHEALKKQAKRLRKRGQVVNYFVIRDFSTWWLLSSVPIWTPHDGPGKPAAVAAPTEVPGAVALSWAYRVLTSANDPVWSRSRGWTPRAIRPKKSKNKKKDTVKVWLGVEADRHFDHICCHLAHAEGWRWPNGTAVARVRVGEMARELAKRLLALPVDTMCIDCQGRIGPPSVRMWTPDGPRCHQRCPALHTNKEASVGCLVDVLLLPLSQGRLTEAAIERLLVGKGYIVFFSTHRAMLEEALQMVGATFRDGGWGIQWQQAGSQTGT